MEIDMSMKICVIINHRAGRSTQEIRKVCKMKYNWSPINRTIEKIIQQTPSLIRNVELFETHLLDDFLLPLD